MLAATAELTNPELKPFSPPTPINLLELFINNYHYYLDYILCLIRHLYISRINLYVIKLVVEYIKYTADNYIKFSAINKVFIY